MGDNNLQQFVGEVSVGHVDQGELLTAMRVYKVRKHLHANMKSLHFEQFLQDMPTDLLIPASETKVRHRPLVRH